MNDIDFNSFFEEQPQRRNKIEKSFETTEDIVKSTIEDNLYVSDTKEEFLKSWSSDLQKRFPQGSWRTINGASVFINGGKVVAGLDGFNKELDKFFDGKNGGKNSSKEGKSKQSPTKTKADKKKSALEAKKKKFAEARKNYHDKTYGNDDKDEGKKESKEDKLKWNSKKEEKELNISQKTKEKAYNYGFDKMSKQELIAEKNKNNSYIQRNPKNHNVVNALKEKNSVIDELIAAYNSNTPVKEDPNKGKVWGSEENKEKPNKLSPRAKQVLKDSKNLFLRTSDPKKLQ